MLGENLSRGEIIQKYTKLVEPLFVYIPWLKKVSGSKVNSIYTEEEGQSTSMAFPVYDSNLMAFVKHVSQTELMNKNYAYIYSWHRIRSVQDELRLIENAKLYDIDILNGILSRYVLGGRTQGLIWNQGVEKGIFLNILLKMKEVLDYWDSPLV